MRRIRRALLPRTGNLTAEPGKTYQYDAENGLISINSGAVATYTYNAAGQRVQKIIGNTTYTYYYDLAGNVVAEWYGTPGGYNGWGKGYVYLGGQLVAQYADSTTYFVHKDHLGSTRLLTKLDKSVHASFDFLPYGESANCTGSNATTNCFTGKERDAESGLDYMGARYYAALFGKFMSPDRPFVDQHSRNPQTWNLYTYSRNSPLSFTDPTGMFAQYVNGQVISSTVDGMDGFYFMEGGRESQQRGGPSGSGPRELTLEELLKLIAAAQSSSADAFTTAVSIFNSLGNNVTVAGDTLRAALAQSNVELPDVVGAILENAERLTKKGNAVTVSNKKEAVHTIGEGKDAQQLKIGRNVSFDVEAGKRNRIHNIRGVEARFGDIWPNIKSVELKTKGELRVLEVKASLLFFQKTVEIPLPK